EPPVARRPVELDVYRIRPVAEEAGERVRRKRQIRAQVRDVLDVRDVERLERVGRPPACERDHPLHERRERDDRGPEPPPEEVRDRQEKPEADGQPRPTEVVGDEEPDRTFRHVAMPCSRSASFRLVFRSVDSLRVPTISAQEMSYEPAGYSFVRVPGMTTERGGT